MAVHARYPAHAFPHDPRAIASSPALDTATGASAFLGEQGCGGHQLAAAVAGNTAFSDITCNNNDSGSPGPRKRARVGDVAGAGLTMDLEGQRALLPPVPLSVVPQAFRPVLCSGAASTSGRPAGPAPVSLGVLSHLYSNGVEIDALVRIETERLRAGLQELRRRHAPIMVSAAERAAARRLRAAEADLGRALARNAELNARLRETVAEAQAWQGVARSHEAASAGLRATLDNLLQSPCATEGEGAGADGDAEDARSCCFEQEQGGAEARCRARACRSCGAAGACVLLLPCRHLCLCRGCHVAAEACPCARPPRTPRSTSCSPDD